MAKFYVQLEERLTYNLEVEASTLQEAEDAAFNAEAYWNNEFHDKDTVIVAIGTMPEPPPVPQKEREHEIIIDDSTLGHLVVNRITGDDVARFMELGQATDFLIMIEGG